MGWGGGVRAGEGEGNIIQTPQSGPVLEAGSHSALCFCLFFFFIFQVYSSVSAAHDWSSDRHTRFNPGWGGGALRMCDFAF